RGGGRCKVRPPARHDGASRIPYSDRSPGQLSVSVPPEGRTRWGHPRGTGGVSGPWDAARREQGPNGDELLHDTSPFSTGAVRQGDQSLSVLPMQRWKHWYPLITMLLGCPHSYIRYVSSSLVAWTDAVQS